MTNIQVLIIKYNTKGSSSDEKYEQNEEPYNSAGEKAGGLQGLQTPLVVAQTDSAMQNCVGGREDGCKGDGLLSPMVFPLHILNTGLSQEGSTELHWLPKMLDATERHVERGGGKC